MQSRMQSGIFTCRKPAVCKLIVTICMAFPLSAASEEWIYTVKLGDNLWHLTQRHLKSMKYVKGLQQLNKISNPYALPPGSCLRIPLAWTRLASEESAAVLAVHGLVTLKRNGQEGPVEPGMRLLVGDEIQSANDAFMTIEFADRSRLKVQDNTLFRLENMRMLGNRGVVDTFVDLQQGRTESSIPKKSDTGSRFRIKTPSAVSSVRGTDFRVGVIDGKSASSSEVLTGVVEVSAGQKSIRVASDLGSVTLQGAAPSSPVRLLPPPDLSVTDNHYQRLPLVISLKPLAGAHAYRAQIATDREFNNLWSEFTATNLPFRDGAIPDGEYWMRVRGIDASSIEGKDAVMPFSLNASPELPFILAPIPDGVTAPQHQEFKWASQPEVSHYMVTISQDKNFSSAAYFNPEVRGDGLTLTESLAPGKYFWRVAAVSETEGAGPLSDAMPFRVPHPAPALEDSEFDDNSMTFAWGAPAEGQRFHFQFASDKAFGDIIHDELTTASRVVIAKPDAGAYYLRTRTIEADGFEGPWGSPQMIDVPRRLPYWYMLFLVFPLLIPL